MFTPLEVKFKNLKHIEESSKKNHHSARKFTIIDQKGVGTRMLSDDLQDD